MRLPTIAPFVFAAVALFAIAEPAQGDMPVGVQARNRITYVFIVVQENRTFDNIFGGSPSGNPQPYPNADSTWPAGADAALTPQPFTTAGPLASHDAYNCLRLGNFQVAAWQSLVNGGCSQAPNGNPMQYLQVDDRQLYWQIARQYEIGDAFFAIGASSSFPAHQFIVSARSQDDQGDIIMDAPDSGHGCFDDDSVQINIPVPGPSGFTQMVPRGRSGECYNFQTLADRLTDANVSWTHYTTFDPALPHVFDGFLNNQGWYQRIDSWEPAPGVLQDLAGGVGARPVAHFNWIKPPCMANSDHPGVSTEDSKYWVPSLVNALGSNASIWNHSVMFVVWDDWGGFYDHVTPPPLRPDGSGPGFRTPFLVISPYVARPGGVVHTQATYASILKFVEDLYKLPAMSTVDAGASDLTGFFDFSSAPRSFAPITGVRSWIPTMCPNSPPPPGIRIW